MSAKMQLSLPLATCAALLAAACQNAPTPLSTERQDAAIIGGATASNGQYPAVVALMLGNQSSLCTGTLIEPDVVLTAAHCVQNESPGSLSVIIDRENLQSPGGGGRSVGVAKRVVHPNYNGNGGGGTVHDVALVFLDEQLTDRTPIAINRDVAARAPGTATTLTGFGINVAGGSNAGVLYTVGKPISACDDVEQIIEDVYNFSMPLDQTRYICWDQTVGTGKCQGDSGGPTFIDVGGETRVAGITSFGDGEGCRYFGVDTAVDAELAFIDEEIGIWSCGANGACNADCGTFGLPGDVDCPLCASDAECGDGYCNGAGQCQPSPFSTGGLGSTCAFGTDCASGLCTSGPGGMACVDYCTVGAGPTAADACPSSFECVDTGQGAQGVCWHTGDGGGCSASPAAGRRAPAAPFAVVGFGALAWAVLGRRSVLARAQR
ncbi:MAG: trypsin-like serine protease [Myxococcales bacterium]|nr:trypsin-like serine protease [Myxococcales bacterium]